MSRLFKIPKNLPFSRKVVDFKPQNKKYPGFIQKLYENANDHYFHHNNCKFHKI